MISFEQSSILITSLYGAATICGILGILLRQHWLRAIACLCAYIGFGTQTFDMARGSHALLPGGLSWGAYLQILAWFILICGFFGQWKTKHTTPTIFMTPLALMLFLLSLRLSQAQITLPDTLNGTFYALHIGSLYLSLALMTLAFAAGIMFIHTERMIKSKAPLTGFRKDFPALAILDKVNALSAIIGFPLFTVGIVSGVIWAGSTWGHSISGDPKEIVSFFVWGLFAWLFHMRTIQGRGGRKPALLALWLFALSAFSILVVNTFMNTHHSFMQ